MLSEAVHLRIGRALQVDNLREVQALRRLSHPNIITLLEVL